MALLGESENVTLQRLDTDPLIKTGELPCFVLVAGPGTRRIKDFARVAELP
jgi:hypothetical protein